MTKASTAESAASEFPLPSRLEKPKVVYVMGAGHSGSTILGVTLGNCGDVFYAGELAEWTLRSGVPKLGGSERTRFWSTVSESVDAAGLFGGDAQRCLERSSVVFRVDRWWARRQLRRRYRRVAEELFCAIAREAGATHIVDSSHFPLRARELQSVQGIELYLVFLVRNPQSVVASRLGHVNRHAVAERGLHTVRKNVDLWLTQLLSVLVFLAHPRERRLFLRHEDFVAEPEGMLRDLLAWLGSSGPVPDLTTLQTGIPIDGNRLLWSDSVALERKPALPVRGSRLTRLLHLPWAAVLSRLQPAAGTSASTSHARVSTPTPS
jgi:sulfotransferase family protein